MLFFHKHSSPLRDITWRKVTIVYWINSMGGGVR